MILPEHGTPATVWTRPVGVRAFADGLIDTPAQVARLGLAPPFNRHPRPAPIELRRGVEGRWEQAPGSEDEDGTHARNPGGRAAP